MTINDAIEFMKKPKVVVFMLILALIFNMPVSGIAIGQGDLLLGGLIYMANVIWFVYMFPNIYKITLEGR